jgi:hypothetical protein
MNWPCLVFPQNREPGRQYLPERVFTQTSLAVVAGAVFVSWTIGVGASYERISCTLRSSRRYFTLGGLEIQLTGAYELVELPLKRIFHLGVPGQCFCRLGPKVTNRIRASNDSGIK